MNNNVIIPQTYKSIYIPEISMYFHVDPGSSLSTDPEITHENYDKIRIYFIKMLIYQSRVYQDTFFKNWNFKGDFHAVSRISEIISCASEIIKFPL